MRDLLLDLPAELHRRALTHPAYAQTPGSSYERLEFLGDAVLGLVIGAELFRRFPEDNEGDLSKLRAAVVSRAACAQVAREHGLAELLIEMAPAEADRTLVQQLSEQDRVLAALAESVIGAAFQVHGYGHVAPLIVASFEGRIGHAVDNHTDAKSELQELAQRRGQTVDYRVVSVDGPDHARVFTMQVQLAGGGLEAVGEGRTKKVAEQNAARLLLTAINNELPREG